MLNKSQNATSIYLVLMCVINKPIFHATTIVLRNLLGEKRLSGKVIFHMIVRKYNLQQFEIAEKANKHKSMTDVSSSTPTDAASLLYRTFAIQKCFPTCRQGF